MLVRPLIHNERTSGFTHTAKILFSDLTAAATTQTIQLDTLAVGDGVCDVAFYLRTQFSGGSATALTAKLGDATDDDGYLEAVSILSGATPVLCSLGNGAYFATKLTGKGYVAAGVLNLILTSTTANVNTLTAGELDVYWSRPNFVTMTP
jgi:hypothetical protein